MSVDFLDANNRFIFINCAKFAYIYDSVMRSTITFNAPLAADSVLVDQNSSQLIVDIGGTFLAYGTNATINGSLLFGRDINSYSGTSPALNNASNDSINNNVPSPPNETIYNNTASSNSSVAPSGFNLSS